MTDTGASPGQNLSKGSAAVLQNALSFITPRTRVILLLTISFFIALTVLIGLKVSKDYQDVLYETERQTASTIGALSDQFKAKLLTLDALMDLTSAQHQTSNGKLRSLPPTLKEALIERVSKSGAARDIQLYDARGNLLFSSIFSTENGNISDEAFFEKLKNQTIDAVHVKGDQLFQVSKAVKSIEGEFIGVVVATLPQTYLQSAAKTAHLGSAQTLYLTGVDGIILSSSQTSGLHTQTITSILGVPVPLPDNLNQATVYAQNENQKSFIVSVRQIDGTPFTLYLSQTRESALRYWFSSLQFYALILIAPLLFGGGVCGILIRQMIQRNAAILAKQTTEERLNLAIEAAHCGIWDWDLDAGKIYWSPSMYAILGREPGEEALSPADVRGFMHTDDRDILAEIADESRQNNDGYDKTFRLRHSHGHWIWIHAKGKLQTPQAVLGNSEPSKRIMGLAVDITELKKAERRVSEMEEYLRDAIENISESFVLWDKSNRLVISNNKFAEFYGVSKDLLFSGARFKDVMQNAEQENVLLSGSNPEGSDPALPAPTDHMQSDLINVGKRWLSVSTRRTSDGGRVSIATDVSPLKEQEDELLKNERELRRYVSELEKSQKRFKREASERAELAVKYASEKARAEEANRSKTEFLANMSHELRTPLNAIMGFAQIMSEQMFGPLGDEKYDSYSRDILDSAQYLLALINDILDMSKIESGKMAIECESVALGHIMQSCLRIVEPRIFDAGLKLHFDPPPLPSVYVDPRAMKQIVLNLLSNAIKFTPEGGEVSIRSEIKEDIVALVFEDTGIGIAEKDLRRLGKPFEQIESQQTKTRKGSGLGLAISKSLIELQQGTLTIQSQPNIGTRVRITMLRHQPKEMAPEETGAKEQEQ